MIILREPWLGEAGWQQNPLLGAGKNAGFHLHQQLVPLISKGGWGVLQEKIHGGNGGGQAEMSRAHSAWREAPTLLCSAAGVAQPEKPGGLLCMLH